MCIEHFCTSFCSKHFACTQCLQHSYGKMVVFSPFYNIQNWGIVKLPESHNLVSWDTRLFSTFDLLSSLEIVFVSTFSLFSHLIAITSQLTQFCLFCHVLYVLKVDVHVINWRHGDKVFPFWKQVSHWENISLTWVFWLSEE